MAKKRFDPFAGENCTKSELGNSRLRIMRILLADGHTLIRETLSAFLKILDSEVEVLEAPGLKEADAIAAREPGLNLIVLDLVMLGMDGLSGVRHMVDAYPDVPVVVLSGADGRDNVTNVMSMGARGLIPKTIGSKDLISTLQRVLSGNIYIPPVTLKSGSASPPATSPEGAAANPVSKLTPRESQVLALVVEGHQNKQIAWALNLKEINLKVHLQKVLRKLGVSNRTQAATFALQRGIALDTAPPLWSVLKNFGRGRWAPVIMYPNHTPEARLSCRFADCCCTPPATSPPTRVSRPRPSR
jgi:DNA-binding NarL/FixJ family response regulator